MLIDWLKADAVISKFIRMSCSENNVAVTLSNEINPNDLVIIKVDAFYNEEVKNPEDPSPDCLIIQKCNGHFHIYIVELKNVNNQKNISVENIVQKFITCLDNFMSERFGNYFHHEDVDIKSLKLFFISDPYGFKANPGRQLTLRGHKFDVLNSIRIPMFFNMHLYIEPHIPDPTINKCA
jgi:hypothetical protein